MMKRVGENAAGRSVQLSSHRGDEIRLVEQGPRERFDFRLRLRNDNVMGCSALRGTSVSFAQDTELQDVDGELVAHVSRNWEIWGPNGGYLAAIALRAAGTRAPAGHRPASVSVQYLSRGDFNDARLSVSPRREARSAACFAVTMLQQDRTVLEAQVWTTNKPEDDGPRYLEASMPDVPMPDEIEAPDGDRHRFWANFDARLVRKVGVGDPDPRGARLEQWIRYKGFALTTDPFLAQARALQMIDTLLWPAHWRRQAAELTYTAPSLDVSVWFQDSSCAADWLLIEAQAPVAGAGLIHGFARVWTQDGKLVATGGSNMLHVPTRPG